MSRRTGFVHRVDERVRRDSSRQWSMVTCELRTFWPVTATVDEVEATIDKAAAEAKAEARKRMGA